MKFFERETYAVDRRVHPSDEAIALCVVLAIATIAVGGWLMVNLPLGNFAAIVFLMTFGVKAAVTMFSAVPAKTTTNRPPDFPEL